MKKLFLLFTLIPMLAFAGGHGHSQKSLKPGSNDGWYGGPGSGSPHKGYPYHNPVTINPDGDSVNHYRDREAGVPR